MSTLDATVTTARCPVHHAPLEGGPVWFRCPAGHGLPAADIDHEYHPKAHLHTTAGGV